MLALPPRQARAPRAPLRGSRRSSRLPSHPPAAKLLSLLTASSDDAVAPESSAPVPTLHPDTTATHPKLRTVSGQPVQTYALGGNREVRQPADLAIAAREHGVNYFFAYSMRDDQIGDYLDGLARLCADPVQRKKIFVAVGMEDFTNHQSIVEHVEKCLARLGTDYVDAFFLEYVCRGDEEAAVDAVRWMRGPGDSSWEKEVARASTGQSDTSDAPRTIGASGSNSYEASALEVEKKRARRGRGRRASASRWRRTRAANRRRATGRKRRRPGRARTSSAPRIPRRRHLRLRPTRRETLADLMRKADEDIAAMAPCELDFLMARYNMAHAKAEWRLFPLAEARDVPVVAFTTTRWNSLQRGHPRWDRDPPTTAECMAWAAGHEATQVVLNSPYSLDQLRGWVEGLAGLGVEGMDQDARETWREYGELVYEESAAFETLY